VPYSRYVLELVKLVGAMIEPDKHYFGNDASIFELNRLKLVMKFPAMKKLIQPII